MPWPDVLHDFDCFTSVNPDYEPMRRLVYDLHSCASSDLYATQTMGGNLLLSPEEELHYDDNVLLISYHPKERRFHFDHRTISKNDDSKDASNEEAWDTLRLFAGYKFGVRLPEARPNKHIQPTANAARNVNAQPKSKKSVALWIVLLVSAIAGVLLALLTKGCLSP